MTALALLFLIVYVLNVIPAFAPPTWMVLSLVSLKYPTANVPLLAVTGASASTLGRFTLAKLSRVFIRQNLLSRSMQLNVDVIKDRLENMRVATVSSLFIYALSPLPSNYLFIAYGLTTLKLRFITIPFFIGRLASYNFLMFSTSAARRHLVMEATEAQSYFSFYFVFSQTSLLLVVYVFTKIDWRALFEEKRVRWLKKGVDQ